MTITPFIEELRINIQIGVKTIKTLIGKKTELNQEIKVVEEEVKHCIEVLKSEAKKHSYNIEIDPNLVSLINYIPVDITSVPLPTAILYILANKSSGMKAEEIYKILVSKGKSFKCKDPYNTVYVTLKNLEAKNKVGREENKWFIIQQPSVNL